MHFKNPFANIRITSKWARCRFKLPASRLFTQSLIQAQIKENIKAPRHWPFWREFTGDRWIPRTKGQLRGKYFHCWRHHETAWMQATAIHSHSWELMFANSFMTLVTSSLNKLGVKIHSTWWHQMETFSALLAFCAGNYRSPVNFPHTGQWHGAFMYSLICAWISSWVNNQNSVIWDVIAFIMTSL